MEKISEMNRREDDQFHLDISRELGGINEKLIALVNSVNGVKEHLKTQNGRIGKLETFKTQIKAQAGTIALIASFVMGIISLVINKFL